MSRNGFEQGKGPYGRTDIRRHLGGEPRTYLPKEDGRIVAGCFSKEMNPNAPGEIYVGKHRDVVARAELLKSQPENEFPVFIRSTNKSRDYYLEGHFKFKDLKNDSKSIEDAEKLSKRYGELAYVLYLDKVS